MSASTANIQTKNCFTIREDNFAAIFPGGVHVLFGSVHRLVCNATVFSANYDRLWGTVRCELGNGESYLVRIYLPRFQAFDLNTAFLLLTDYDRGRRHHQHNNTSLRRSFRGQTENLSFFLGHDFHLLHRVKRLRIH